MGTGRGIWIRQSPELLAAVDDALHCREISEAWRGLLGLEEADLPRLPLEALLDHEAAQRTAEPIRRLIHSGGVVRRAPVSLLSCDGSVEGLLSAWPVPRQAGSGLAVIAVLAGPDASAGRRTTTGCRGPTS